MATKCCSTIVEDREDGDLAPAMSKETDVQIFERDIRLICNRTPISSLTAAIVLERIAQDIRSSIVSRNLGKLP